MPGNNVLPAEIADFYIRVSCVTIISSDRSSSRYYQLYIDATNKQTIQLKFQGMEATYIKTLKPSANIKKALMLQRNATTQHNNFHHSHLIYHRNHEEQHYGDSEEKDDQEDVKDMERNEAIMTMMTMMTSMLLNMVLMILTMVLIVLIIIIIKDPEELLLC